jgi:periodic tryptophan protein 2
MKCNYQLRRVCGAYYGRPIESGSLGNSTINTQWSGSNILFYHDHSNRNMNTTTTTSSSSSLSTTYLISAVLNRVQIIDLQSIHVRTVPIEARSNIIYISISPTVPLLVVVDVHNYVMLIHITRNIVLHRWKLSTSSNSVSGYCSCVPQFAPNSGQYIAFGIGTHVQVWYIPSITTTTTNSSHNDSTNIHEFCPMQLFRTYTGFTQDVTHITWSYDEQVIVASSKDCTIRLYTLQNTKYKEYQPISLLGHKSSIVSVYFAKNSNKMNIASSTLVDDDPYNTIYSISSDGAFVVWTGTIKDVPSSEEIIIDHPPSEEVEVDDNDEERIEHENNEDDAIRFFASGKSSSSSSTPKRQKRDPDSSTTLLSSTSSNLSAADVLLKRKYIVSNRMYLQQECINGTTITCTSYCYGGDNNNNNIIAIGFSSGIFGIYEMPNCINIHTLSVGMNQRIQTCVLNPSGSWLALGCPISQQLLVWEWTSETYILKQRGHAYGMSCMAYSPDAICIATGGEDGKIKLWNSSTGFCYVTFPSESCHTAAITKIAFANDSVVITCSLDGTVKAHDLYRYRTFKTYTSPTPVQFLSLAIDNAGEIVVAGSNDPFHIYVWNIQTGQLLDILTGHTGPICDLQFQSIGGILVSGSWDGTIKTWDIYKGTNHMTTESYQHTSDVICIAVSPNNQQICASTMNGLLSFWNINDHKLLHEIDGRYDITGGRKLYDRRTADNNANSKYFTSISYTIDGTCIIAGGNSKYICIYEISQQILLKKFQLSYNRSLDGVLDEVRNKERVVPEKNEI